MLQGLTLWNSYRSFVDLKTAAELLEHDVPGIETYYTVSEAGPWRLWFIIPTPKTNGNAPDVTPPNDQVGARR